VAREIAFKKNDASLSIGYRKKPILENRDRIRRWIDLINPWGLIFQD
jgi:hypothetical protein